jgi:hypothetical protein
MDVQVQLERILRRVQLSAAELELQPEAFQATQELRIASGELASVLETLEELTDIGPPRGGPVARFVSPRGTLSVATWSGPRR